MVKKMTTEGNQPTLITATPPVGAVGIWFSVTTTIANEEFDFSSRHITGTAIISWGDGSSDTITDANIPKHTYAAAGTYQVKINGNDAGNNTCTYTAITNTWYSAIDTHITAVDLMNPEAPIDPTTIGAKLDYLFSNCKGITGTLPAWGDYIITVDGCYANAGANNHTFNLPAWGTNITSANGTYESVNFNANTTVPAWSKNIIDVGYCYFNTTGLTGVVPAWGLKTTDAYCTYWNCTGLTHVPGWGPKLVDVYSCYRNCSGITTWDSSLTYNPTPKEILWHEHCTTGCSQTFQNLISGAWNTIPECIIFRVKTTKPQEGFSWWAAETTLQFAIPTGETFTIDWGDDTIEEFTGNWTISPRTDPMTYMHIYTEAGEYQVKLIGQCAYNFAEPTINPINGKLLAGRTNNIIAVDNINLSAPASINNMFANHKLDAVDNMLTLPDTFGTNITTMTGCFRNCNSITIVPAWPTGITNVDYCYAGCNNLKTAVAWPTTITTAIGVYKNTLITEMPDWTNNILNATECFMDCPNISIIKDWSNTIQNVSYCFSNCTLPTDIPAWGNSITNLDHCYDGCLSLQNTQPWPANITSAQYVYKNCIRLIGTLPAWTNNITNVSGCYYGCIRIFDSIPWSNSITVVDYCYSKTNIATVPEWTANITAANNCYQDCTNITAIPVWSANMQNVSNCYNGCTGITNAVPWVATIEAVTNCYRSCHSIVNFPATWHTAINAMPDNIRGSGAYSNCVLDANPLLRELFDEDWGGTRNASEGIIFTIRTTTANENGTLPDRIITVPAGETATINWGDGTIENFTTTTILPDHIYAEADEYQITITGNYTKLYSATQNNKICPHVISVDQLKPSAANVDISFLFQNCNNLLYIPAWGDNITKVSGCYYGCRKILTAPEWGDNIIDASYTYAYTSISIAPAWGPNITNVAYCYQGCTSLTTAPVWGTYDEYPLITAITNAAYCYYGCSALVNYDNRWNIAAIAMPATITTHDKCVYNAQTNLRLLFDASWGGMQGGEGIQFSVYVHSSINNRVFNFKNRYITGGYYIDWGDGTKTSNLTNTEKVAFPTHRYAADGTYTINVLGPYTEFTGYEGDDMSNIQSDYTISSTIKSITNLNPQGLPGILVNLSGLFACCMGNYTIPTFGDNISNVTNLYAYCRFIKTVPAWGISISKASRCYYNCTGINNTTVLEGYGAMPANITEHDNTVLNASLKMRGIFKTTWGGILP